MTKKLLLGLLCLLPFNAVFADTFYAGLGFSKMDFDDSFDSVSPTNFFLRGGIILTENFDVGMEMNLTMSADEIQGVDFEVDTYSLFGRLVLPLSESIRLYGKAGTANTEITASNGGYSLSFDDDDLMYGAGVEVGLGPDSPYLDIDYTQYYDDDSVETTAFSVGLGYRF